MALQAAIMQGNQKKIDEFQSRMSDWVARQGLIFQLMHGGSVQGASSALLGWFAGIAFRVLILVLIGGLILFGYLVRRPFSENFNADLKIVVEESLDAGSVVLGPTSRKNGYLEITSLDMVGGDDSFFDRASIRNCKTRMGLLAGLVSKWRGESIEIERLEMAIKSGSDEPDGAGAFEAIFQQGDDFSFERIEVADASLSWGTESTDAILSRGIEEADASLGRGYSEFTEGRIENAKLSAQRNEDGWRLTVTGGTFSQNWLKGLRIDVLECWLTREGVQIVEGRMRSGNGLVTLAAEVRGPVTDPQVTGSGQMKNFPFGQSLNPEVEAFVRGSLSGSFTLGGSPYSSSGIAITAEIVMDSEDEIVISDEIKLLDAISLVDRYRSYKKVRFRSGSFNMETDKNVAVFKDIRLEAKDHMALEGEFMARPPLQKEVDAAIYLDEDGKPATFRKAEDPGEELVRPPVSGDINLAEAARAARENSENDAKIKAYFESEVLGLEMRQREEDVRAIYRLIPFIQGNLRLGLHAKAFEQKRSQQLSELYPVEEASGLRWLELRANHSLPSLGAEMARNILFYLKK